MVKTFGQDSLSLKVLEPVKSMLGRVKLTNNPEERSQGWYYHEKATKVKKHHDQIELFATQLQDDHRLLTRDADSSSTLPGYKKITLGPADIETMSIPADMLSGPDPNRLDLEFACDVFAASQAPVKLPKIKMTGFNVDIEYEMGNGAESTPLYELKKFIHAFDVATTEKFWTGCVFCSFQQMEEVSDVF